MINLRTGDKVVLPWESSFCDGDCAANGSLDPFGCERSLYGDRVLRIEAISVEITFKEDSR